MAGILGLDCNHYYPILTITADIFRHTWTYTALQYRLLLGGLTVRTLTLQLRCRHFDSSQFAIKCSLLNSVRERVKNHLDTRGAFTKFQDYVLNTTTFLTVMLIFNIFSLQFTAMFPLFYQSAGTRSIKFIIGICRNFRTKCSRTPSSFF